jgi:dipeptidyl aminopeptidase/acylaminoacyl peptidase
MVPAPLGWNAAVRYPLAVQIHGGPHAMWGPGEASMWLEYQMLAGAGYTVFFTNPRGSGGYGAASLQSIHRNWGTPPAATSSSVRTASSPAASRIPTGRW